MYAKISGNIFYTRINRPEQWNPDGVEDEHIFDKFFCFVEISSNYINILPPQKWKIFLSFLWETLCSVFISRRKAFHVDADFPDYFSPFSTIFPNLCGICLHLQTNPGMKWSPIWSAITNFCQKRYASLIWLISRAGFKTQYL